MITRLTSWLDQRIDHAARTAALALYEKLRADLREDLDRLGDRLGVDDVQRLATEIVAQIRRVFPFLVMDPRALAALEDEQPPSEGTPLP